MNVDDLGRRAAEDVSAKTDSMGTPEFSGAQQRRRTRTRLAATVSAAVLVAVFVGVTLLVRSPESAGPFVNDPIPVPTTVADGPAPTTVPDDRNVAALEEEQREIEQRIRVTQETGWFSRCGPVRFDWPAIDIGIDIEGFEPFEGDLDSMVGEAARPEFEASLGVWETTQWWVVEQTNQSLLLFGASDPQDASAPQLGYAQFERIDGEWQASGWGGCQIEVAAEGFGVATFDLDPNNPPDPDETTLQVVATERTCASGQAPTGRETLPVVIETAYTVEITVLVQNPTGNQTCPSNPAFPLTVELEAPLDSREILDGAIYPAETRPDPPSSTRRPVVFESFTSNGGTFEFGTFPNVQGPDAPCVGVRVGATATMACPTETAEESEYAALIDIRDTVFVVGFGLEEGENIVMPDAVRVLSTAEVDGRRFFLIQLAETPGPGPFEVPVVTPDGTVRSIPSLRPEE